MLDLGGLTQISTRTIIYVNFKSYIKYLKGTLEIEIIKSKTKIITIIVE